MGFSGYPFTWNNKRSDRANIQVRLDKGMANGDWRLLFLDGMVTHLIAISSNHCPLLLESKTTDRETPKPFKFKYMWIRAADVGQVITEAWNSKVKGQPFQLISKLKKTKIALKEWNKSNFGHVQTGIRELTNQIEELKTRAQTMENLEEEASLQQELEKLLKKEEITQRDKAKTRQIEERHENTRHFHLSTIVHRRQNAIYYIQTSESSWI